MAKSLSKKETLENDIRECLRSVGIGEETIVKVLRVFMRTSAFKRMCTKEDPLKSNVTDESNRASRRTRKKKVTRYGPTIGFPFDQRPIPPMRFPRVKSEVTTWSKLLKMTRVDKQKSRK
jgi:hypothetical protein